MISIVVPLYNKETAILATLSSIREQSYKEWECVIVDDGSTDNSASIVREYVKQDARFVYYIKPNGGPAAARNYGVKKAKADWIAFLDADDRFEENALNHFADLIMQHKGYNMYCCNFYVEQNGRRSLFSQRYDDGLVKNNFKSWYFHTLMPCQGTTLYQRQLLLNHPFDETLRRFEDASMLFDIMRTERIFRSSKPTFTYFRQNSAASGVRKDFQEDFFAHIHPQGKPFWEQMILYQYYVASFDLYPEQVRLVYPTSPFNSMMELFIKSMNKWIVIKNRISQLFVK